MNFKLNKEILLLLVEQQGHLLPDGLGGTLEAGLLLPALTATSTPTGAESLATV